MPGRVHALVQHPQDENAGVRYPVIDGMACVFMAAQAGTDSRIIPAQQGGVGEQAEAFGKTVIVGIGLCFAEMLKGIALDMRDIGLRLTGQTEAHNPMSFLAFSLI